MVLQKKDSRIVYLDYLRILAAIGPVVGHLMAQEWGVTALWGWDRRILDVYKLAFAWTTNAFLMISGIFFLDNARPLNMKKLYTKNVFKLAVTFFFWSAVYALAYAQPGDGFGNIFLAFLKGHYHMWYLLTAMACYISVPVLRKITESTKVMEYFLGITFVYFYLLPGIGSILEISSVPAVSALGQAMTYWRMASNFGFGEMIFCFVLGYYLYQREMSAKLYNSLILLGLFGYVGRLGLREIYIYINAVAKVPFVFGWMDVLASVGMFLFGKYYLCRIRCNGKLIRVLADCTLGVYLVHVLVMDWLLARIDITALKPALFAPLIVLAELAISLAVTWLMRQVPILKKYVV